MNNKTSKKRKIVGGEKEKWGKGVLSIQLFGQYGGSRWVTIDYST
jgi:hypothetical protein